MTEQQERYDRIAEGYATWWSPVHRAATLRLLEEIAAEVATDGTRLLDVGCGTGVLARAAVERWPALTVDAIDASEGMLAVAERESRDLAARDRERLHYGQAFADGLPFEDGTFDVAVSAFVYQLVPSRPRALREARRVLRRGGRLAYVTWLAGPVSFAADIAFDDALAAVGLEPPDRGDAHPGDLRSPDAAVAQLRRAGFSDATARASEVAHDFTPEGYLGFIARFDDEDLFTSLEPDLRARLEAELLQRLRALPPAGLRLVLPIVYASGRREPERRGAP